MIAAVCVCVCVRVHRCSALTNLAGVDVYSGER